MFYRFPFNWKNPMGYLIAYTLLLISVLNFIYFVTCCVTLGIGIFVFITSVATDLKNELIAFADRIKIEPNPMIMIKSLHDFIQFHSNGKRYEKFFNLNLYKTITFESKFRQFTPQNRLHRRADFNNFVCGCYYNHVHCNAIHSNRNGK